jgi:hypothetical protein
MRCRARILGAVLLAGAAATTMSAQSGHAPRTPWGDPDLQGNYTNLSEAGTPWSGPRSSRGAA